MEDGVNAYKPDLATLKKYFEDSRDLTYTARTNATVDIDYYDGNQWTAAERAELRKRKQPDNVFNFVRLSVNGTLGVLRQGNTDPRAYPRNPGDEDGADVASKTLRYIADYNNFDALKGDCAYDYLVPGTMAAITEIDADKRVTVNQIRWEEFFYDPRSRRKDFRDARYMGVAKWQYADDIALRYPDAKTELEATIAAGSAQPIDDTFEDRPSDAATTWVDRNRRRLMVVDLYHLEGGKWMRCIYHAGGILESGISPYVNAKGGPVNPIEAQSCYVDRENNRYGVVRDMRGPADEINKRHSKLLHRLSMNMVQEAEIGALQGTDIELVRREAARPDGVLPSGTQIINQTANTMGEAQLLQEAKAIMDRFSPNPAVLGRQQDQSGRASLIRQQAGLTEQAIILGGIEDWENRVYRQMWERARQYWQEPMWIRVTDDEGAPEFVAINKPVMGPPQVGMDPATGMPVVQPTVLGYENKLAELDVDIIIDSIPDTANVQQEQFAQMAELAKVYPQEVTFDDLLELSTMPNKRAVLEKRKQRAEQSQQQAQQQQQLQMRGAVAKISETEANAAYKGAQARNELMKPQIEAAQALVQLNQPAAGAYPGAPFAGT